MKPVFYLFIPLQPALSAEIDSVPLSWAFKNVNNELKVASGSLDDAAIAATGFSVSVVLPGENIVSLKADVPGNNLQRIQQAIPYVLEDSVIDDVDDLHFAIKKSHKNSYDVAVVNKQYLESIVQEISKAGVDADVITADYLLLKPNTLLCDADRVIFNSQELKFSSSVEGANKILESYKGNDSINLIHCSDNDGALPTGLDELPTLNKKVCNKILLACLTENTFLSAGINLLQGLYKKKKLWTEQKKRWLPAMALCLLWLSVQGGVFVYEYINLSNQRKSLNLEINEIYKSTFPDARRIVNAKAQMQQKLSVLEKRHGQSERSFSHMLSSSAAVLARMDGLKIKSLRYHDGNLIFEFQLESLALLEKIKQQLIHKNGFLVEIKNASSSKNAVTARIQITGASL